MAESCLYGSLLMSVRLKVNQPTPLLTILVAPVMTIFKNIFIHHMHFGNLLTKVPLY